MNDEFYNYGFELLCWQSFITDVPKWICLVHKWKLTTCETSHFIFRWCFCKLRYDLIWHFFSILNWEFSWLVKDAWWVIELFAGYHIPYLWGAGSTLSSVRLPNISSTAQCQGESKFLSLKRRGFTLTFNFCCGPLMRAVPGAANMLPQY